MDPALWNLLHDGSLVGVRGQVPGQLQLVIECGYLRARFLPEGVGFHVRLEDCSLFEFTPWDEAAVTDLVAIEAMDLELLSAESSDPLKVCCTGGLLRVRYGSLTLSLDSGEALELAQLREASESYWREWQAKHDPLRPRAD